LQEKVQKLEGKGQKSAKKKWKKAKKKKKSRKKLLLASSCQRDDLDSNIHWHHFQRSGKLAPFLVQVFFRPHKKLHCVLTPPARNRDR
jgi:hypothetical protein